MTSSIAALHVAKKQLGLDDETYRAKLQRITGKSSAKDMSESERQSALAVFRNEGFQPAANSRRANGQTKLTGRFAKKLQALWIAAWNLGIVRERDDAALITFVKRQTGIDHTRWLRAGADANRAIEALKAWVAREGGVDWSVAPYDPEYARAPGFKIAWAQWLRLGGNPHANSVRQFRQEATALAGVPFEDISDAGWRVVMNAFGERIRTAKKVRA